MRDTATRKTDVLQVLGGNKDAWLSTADPKGRPHVIATSTWWTGSEIVVTTRGASQTARNMALNPQVKLALGPPEDAVTIDAEVVESRPVEDAPELATGFASGAGWDPREVGKGWMFFRLKPKRIQAFRGYDEIENRDVMRGSRWLV